MNFESIKNWVMNNKTTAIIIGVVVVLFFFGKKLMPTVRRRRRKIKIVNRPRRRSSNTIIKSGKNKGLRPWQVKGSPAARARMARLRRMKR